jgi:hypothetical protein
VATDERNMSGNRDEQGPCTVEELRALAASERAAAEVFELLSRSHSSPTSAARLRRQAAEARRNAEHADRQARRLTGDDRDG